MITVNTLQKDKLYMEITFMKYTIKIDRDF